MDPAASPDLDPFEGISDLSYHGIDLSSRGSAVQPIPLATAARSVLSEDFRRRLQRTEHEVASMTQAEREGVIDWLGAMLHRPPLERPNRRWLPMRALAEALWWDLADRTPADPDDPDAGNPRLDANHPWGEGAES